MAAPVVKFLSRHCYLLSSQTLDHQDSDLFTSKTTLHNCPETANELKAFNHTPSNSKVCTDLCDDRLENYPWLECDGCKMT